MNIVIAPDSFKGSLSAFEVARHIALGFKKACPQCQIIELPVADGGEGSTDVLLSALGGRKVVTKVNDPLGRPIDAYYGLTHNDSTAIVEVAQASGLTRLQPEEQNPLHTSSYGTGQLIQHALDQDVEDVWVCLGGSATVDGGLGMASALGLKAFDVRQRLVAPTGQGLIDLKNIDVSNLDPRLKKVRFKSLYDVDNVLTGPRGAQLFMKQKGATPEIMIQLDNALQQWGELLETQFDRKIIHMSSAGAAGGLGAGTMAFLEAEPVSGIDFVLEQVHFFQHLETAQFVISGEGRVDDQTIHGKVIAGVAKHTQPKNLPLFVLCGAKTGSLDDLYQIGVTAVHSILPRPATEGEAFHHAAEWLQDTSFTLGKSLMLG